MKIISIGDLHGLNVWTKFEDIPQLLVGEFTPDFDKYIFVGDYTDSFSVSNVEILHNLKQLVAFKQKYPNQVVLLLGNHDLQYWFSFNTHGCSGFRSEMYWDLNEFFRQHRDLFQVSFQYEDILWTHAGISKGWYEYSFPYKDKNVADSLNKAFLENNKSLFDIGRMRGGWQDVGGPFWADKQETWNKPLKDYHQIVGHTRVKEITYREINPTTSITYIDCLENGKHTPHILEI